MTSERLTWIILGALAVSLILNITALIRISDLRSEVDQVAGHVFDPSHLQSQIYDLEQRISELSEEQGPIADMLWRIDDVGGIDCDGDVPVAVSWSFRELPANADVHLEIGREGHDGWVQIDAEQTGDVDFSARHEVPLVDDLVYRVIADGEYSTIATEPAPAAQLRYLTDRRVIFEEGETRSQDGQTWTRYYVAPMTPLLSPCNEIVSANLTLHYDGQPSATVELQRGHPGDGLPDGYEEDIHLDESREAREIGVGFAFDSTASIPEGDHTPGEDDQWWTDWIEVEALAQPRLEIEYGDGTTRTIEHVGPH